MSFFKRLLTRKRRVALVTSPCARDELQEVVHRARALQRSMSE